jgi:preprotein translocase subunit SecE
VVALSAIAFRRAAPQKDLAFQASSPKNFTAGRLTGLFFWPGGSGSCGTKSPPTPLPLLSPGGKAICPTIRRSAGTAFSRRCGGRSFPQHAGAKNLAKTSPLEFIQQVRTETSKVTWPTRRETVMTGVMVVIMTTILAVFFFGVDSILQAIVTMLLKLAQ